MSKAHAGERIAKIMARAGVCSRREAEAMILSGRVTVNGSKLTSPATNVTPSDVVLVDGSALPVAGRSRLFRYYKPKGLLTTQRDPRGRPTLFERRPPDLPTAPAHEVLNLGQVLEIDLPLERDSHVLLVHLGLLGKSGLQQ